MPNLILADAKILIGPYNLSGYSNQVELNWTADMLDVSVFDGSGTRRFKPGLFNAELTVSGFNDYDRTNPDSSGIDDRLFDRIGAVAVPASLIPVGLAEGDRAFSFKHINASYNPIQASVGEMAAFTLDGRAVGSRLIRGVVAALGAKNASGNGSAQNLGALTSAQRLYAALHCTAASGGTPTCSVEIESDDAVGFPSPTSRITFTQLTTTGSQWQELAGPQTDTYWRAKWTLGGSTPSFTIWVVIGIH